jgi:peptide/nickel transport system permease protein
MILPWIALAAAQAGLTARVTRTAIIEAAGEDYVRTAQAKGQSRRRIAWVHVLRPAAIPAISSLSVGLGTRLGSAALIDQTFALDGIGQALLTADRPLTPFPADVQARRQAFLVVQSPITEAS